MEAKLNGGGHLNRWPVSIRALSDGVILIRNLQERSISLDIASPNLHSARDKGLSGKSQDGEDSSKRYKIPAVLLAHSLA